jgi:hypothetical protein
MLFLCPRTRDNFISQQHTCAIVLVFVNFNVLVVEVLHHTPLLRTKFVGGGQLNSTAGTGRNGAF